MGYEKTKDTIIRNLPEQPKSWWAGDPRVEPYMEKVSQAISRHVPKGEAWTDIYNRAYEAVYAAIKDSETAGRISELAKKHVQEKLS